MNVPLAATVALCVMFYGLGCLSIIGAVLAAWFLGGKVFLGGKMR